MVNALLRCHQGHEFRREPQVVSRHYGHELPIAVQHLTCLKCNAAVQLRWYEHLRRPSIKGIHGVTSLRCEGRSQNCGQASYQHPAQLICFFFSEVRGFLMLNNSSG